MIRVHSTLENGHCVLLTLPSSNAAQTAGPPVFVSVVNKIAPIFSSNAGDAFHFSQEGRGQCALHSFSILRAN